MDSGGISKHSHEHDEGARKALSDRSTATVIGVLFIVGTVAGALSGVVASSILSGADILTRVADRRPQMVLATLLLLTMGFVLAMVPVVFYPVARRHSEILAMGYVVFRGALETFTYIAGALGWLLLVALSEQPLAAGAPIAGSVLVAEGVLWDQMLAIPFVLGAFMFYWLLYRSRLVPRWLSVWGLVGAALYIAVPLADMFGLSLGILMAPLAIQEMVMGVWLIAKGFSSAAEVPMSVDSAAVPRVAAAGGRS